MNFWEILLLGVGLAMDAFAVSIGKGLSVKKVQPKHAASVFLWFGGFQALMPLIGYFLGAGFEKYVTKFDHWIAFFLLALIGVNMIREAFGEEESTDGDFGFKKMLLLALATSIDALAIGISLAMRGGTNIWLAIFIIGVVTGIISAAGVFIGNLFGARYRKPSVIAGGAILILLGIKILVEDLFF